MGRENEDLEIHRASERQLSEVNKFRSQMGMDLIKIKKRNCYRCNAAFKSEGPHNRMCQPCRLRLGNSNRMGGDYEGF